MKGRSEIEEKEQERNEEENNLREELGTRIQRIHMNEYNAKKEDFFHRGEIIEDHKLC